MPDNPVRINLGGAFWIQRNHLELAEVCLTDIEVLRTNIIDIRNVVLVKVVFASISTTIAWEIWCKLRMFFQKYLHTVGCNSEFSYHQNPAGRGWKPVYSCLCHQGCHRCHHHGHRHLPCHPCRDQPGWHWEYMGNCPGCSGVRPRRCPGYCHTCLPLCHHLNPPAIS